MLLQIMIKKRQLSEDTKTKKKVSYRVRLYFEANFVCLEIINVYWSITTSSHKLSPISWKFNREYSKFLIITINWKIQTFMNFLDKKVIVFKCQRNRRNIQTWPESDSMTHYIIIEKHLIVMIYQCISNRLQQMYKSKLKSDKPSIINL